MNLMTQEVKEALKPLYHYEKQGEEPIAVVKFFDPTSNWTWYAAEGEEQSDGDWLLWGVVEGHEFEYGYFTLNELLNAKKGLVGLKALPIERDLYFKPIKLNEIKS